MEKTLEPDRLADFLDPRELALVDALGVGAGSGSGAGAGSGSGGGAAASSFFFFFFFSLSACQKHMTNVKWLVGYNIFKPRLSKLVVLIISKLYKHERSRINSKFNQV